MASMVLPGQTAIPKGWGESMVLYSLDGVSVVVDGAPPGPNGRLYIIPAGKPIKVPFEVGRFLLEDGRFPYTDVVRVAETESDTGITYDVEGAKKDALSKSELADDLAFKNYVSGAVADFVKNNKPVPQPPEQILKIMERRGFRLEQYGISPIGWKKPEDAKVAAMAQENSALKQQMDEMRKRLDALQLAQSKKG
jgi:hypothetical protein